MHLYVLVSPYYLLTIGSAGNFEAGRPLRMKAACVVQRAKYYIKGGLLLIHL